MPRRHDVTTPLLAVLTSIAMATTGCARDAASRDTRMIDSLFARFDAPGQPGASVLVVQNGRVITSKAYGLADVEHGVRATPATNYRLASVTKQFTAMAILLLVQDRRLALDTPVHDVLPGFPAYDANRPILVRHLLSHTSGVWDYEDFVPDTQSRQVKDRDALELIRSQAKATYFPAGSAWRYSNSGYALLALIVEQISGQSFATFLHDRIFIPAGMTRTVAFEDGVSTVPDRAFGHRVRGDTVTRTDQSNTSAVLGDGGIYSSIDDLAKWDAALDRHAFAGDSLWRRATTPAVLTDGKVTEYAFGWFVDTLQGHRRLRHHGETRGFTNFVQRFPDDHLTIVILTNRSDSEPWVLGEQLAERLLPSEHR